MPESKKLNLNLDYKLPPLEDGEKRHTPAEMSANYIEVAVASAYSQGMDGQMRRIYGRLQTKLADAVLTDGELDLENAEVDLLKKSFRDAKFPAHLSRYVSVFEEEMEQAFSKKDKEKK